jgi:hypothetical protein
MQFFRAIFLVVGISFFLIAGAGCRNITAGSRTWNSEEINQIGALVDRAGTMQPPSETVDTIKDKTREMKKNKKYIYEKHEANNKTMSVLELGLSDNILWPGALIRGDKLANYVYEPIVASRQPITISLTGETVKGAGDLYLKVKSPSRAGLSQSISDLLERAIPVGKKVPANFDYTCKQVYNESHMSAFLGADVSYGIYDLSTKFNWDSITRKNKIIAKFRQIYFTVNVDTPVHPSDFFSPSMGVKKIEALLPAGSAPVYVGSVSYGVMALMFIETDYSEEQINNSIQAGMDGKWGVKITGGYTSEDILSSSSINIVVYGGDTAGLENEELNLKGFKKIISNSYSCSPNNWGKPLSYNFYHLSNNTLAGFNSTSEYTIVRVSPAYPHVRLTVEKMKMDWADDDTQGGGCCKGRCDGVGGEDKVELDYYNVKVTAYNRSNQSPATLHKIDNAKKIVSYGDSGWGVSMDSGSIRPLNKSDDWHFNNWDFDLYQAVFVIEVYATDYDGSGCSREEAKNTKKIYGSEFFDNNGVHQVFFQASDFEGHFDIKIECLNCN